MKVKLSAGGIGRSASSDFWSTCSTYLHIGVLDAEYGRVTQALGGDDFYPKLALAAGRHPQDCRLNHMQTYLVARFLVYESGNKLRTPIAEPSGGDAQAAKRKLPKRRVVVNNLGDLVNG
ncbi:hypothetical protein ABBQ38_011022 [Trebouxia sp. C0009 RCD-2024]